MLTAPLAVVSLRGLTLITLLTCLCTGVGADRAAAASTYHVQGAGTHAFWLPGGGTNTPSTYYHFLPLSDSPAVPQAALTFTDGIDWSDATAAKLTGRLRGTAGDQ